LVKWPLISPESVICDLMKAMDLTSSLSTTPMYWLMFAPVHVPNFSAPEGFRENCIW